MKITFSVVAEPHPLTARGQLARTESGSFCWDDTTPNPSNRTLIATIRRGSRRVGILKYDVAEVKGVRVLRSVGTFVWPLYRGINIAQKMWARALSRDRIGRVEVSVVSDRGKTLVEALSRQFPRIQFELRESGDRPLRSLKGKGKGRRRAA